jgi:molecular chaperone GrpE
MTDSINDSGSISPPEEGSASLPSAEETISKLQADLADMKEKYLRSLADGENARKRLAREKQEVVAFSVENTICDFLPIIDNFENALRLADAASGEVKNWSLGFQMILSQFKQSLQNCGISSFSSEGALFDPNLHEAVEIVETNDIPEGTIVQEFTKGYRSATRTIRPARVKVARALPKSQTPVSETEIDDMEN